MSYTPVVEVLKPTNQTESNVIKNNLPIGLRNNNPLNIRVSGNAWLGKTASTNQFEKFAHLKYGIRAGVKNLQTYYKRDNLKTIKQIISKWAPTNENDTTSYINNVSRMMFKSPTEVLNLDADTMADLFTAMSAIELGVKHKIPQNEVKQVIKEFNLI